MGTCVSHFTHDIPRANVVSHNGDLLQYALPITVSKVLQSHHSSFLCNSDSLYFDDYIPALPLHAHLHPAQIYFLLPLSKLTAPLPASEMAKLAVTATAALSGRRNKRISPNPDPDPQSNHTVRKLPRAKMAVRSFSMKLATISEGSSFHYYTDRTVHNWNS